MAARLVIGSRSGQLMAIKALDSNHGGDGATLDSWSCHSSVQPSSVYHCYYQ